MMHGLENLPNFLAYFGACLVLPAAFLALYTLILPGDEWGQIRQGNVAAALSLGGATIGFCLPLAAAVIHSASFSEMVMWAAVALVLQLMCFAAMHLLRRGDTAEATLLATGAIGLGILNAACLG